MKSNKLLHCKTNFKFIKLLKKQQIDRAKASIICRSFNIVRKTIKSDMNNCFKKQGKEYIKKN